MKYESRLKLQENIIYGVVWALVFTIPILALYLSGNKEESVTSFNWNQVFSIWKEIVPFFILFLLHNFFIAPILIHKQQKGIYFTIAFCLLVLFAAGQAVFNTPKHPDRMIPPPEMEKNEHPPLPPDSYGGPQLPDVRPNDGGPGARRFEGDNPPGRQNLTRILMDNPAITNTFIAFLLLSMNLGIKEYFRSVKNQRENEELRRQHLEQELEYLRYQINPHFFMNTLNNIHALVDIDPEQAKNTILELSRLMRYLLYDGSRPTIPLAKETEFLKHYIALMRLRYSDQVRIEVDIPEDVPDVQVPPLLFISFVENAFKHGISYLSESFIMVSLNVREGFITFSCINSKHERNQDPHSGIGLENTQKRLKLLYHDEYTFNINENAKTYEVLLKIPLSYDQVSGD